MIRRTPDGLKRLAGADQERWVSYVNTSDPFSKTFNTKDVGQSVGNPNFFVDKWRVACRYYDPAYLFVRSQRERRRLACVARNSQWWCWWSWPGPG